MRNRVGQQFVVMLMIGLISVAIVTNGLAAQSTAPSSLKETQRQTDRTVVPVAAAQSSIGVELWLNRQCGTPFYTGETAVIYFKTNVDGYVTLYNISTTGNVLVVFPNENTPDNYVKAGQNYQIPARNAGYELIVEGPEGIEYLDAVASTDAYYHWDYRQGEPRWLKDWGLQGRKQQEARTMDQATATAFNKSSEAQNLPSGLGELGKQSLTQNFQLSRNLREQVQSKLAERPRQTTQTTTGTAQVTPAAMNYSTASCYWYVVDAAAKPTSTSPARPDRRTSEPQKVAQIPTPTPTPRVTQKPITSTDLRRQSNQDDQSTRKLTPVARSTVQVDLWLDKQCGSPYYTGEKALIYFSTDADGYVTLYDIDTQGNVNVIFPNRNTPDNFVKAGQTYQIPAREADYDLIVEGPEGTEYIDAVASTNVRYHWNYQQGEPRWLQDWGIQQRKGVQQEARTTEPTTGTTYQESEEFRTLPKEFGAIGKQSATQNFQLSRKLQEQVRSQIAVVPRPSGQQSQGQQTTGTQAQPVAAVADYSTDSCYFYVVEQATPASATTLPPSLDYLRQQERAFQQIPDFDVRRFEDRLIVEMPASILFDTNSFDLRYAARQDLEKVVNILLRYPDTMIVVKGHTDSAGDEGYNQRLSESRAISVANYLLARGVQSSRIRGEGYGETMPVASNYTEEGRQRNRRVELDIRVADQVSQ